jgi:spermidine synthase
VAQQHFRLPGEDARLHIEIADGAQYMMRKSPRFDLILVDGFDADALAGDLDTLSFYLNCRQRLSSQGLLVTNLLSRRRNFRDSVARIKTAFDDRAIAFPSCDSGNAIAVAATGATIDRTLAELEEAAATLKTTTGLKLAPTLSRLAASGVFRGARLQL